MSANDIVWTGRVNFTDSSDVGTTGVATLTLTPDIGVTNLPALAQGAVGPAPTLRNVTVNQVAAGVTPPASSWTLVSPGVYDLTAYVNKGADGVAGTFTIAGATDLADAVTDKSIPIYSSADSKWHNSAQRVVAVFQPTGFTAYAGSGTQATLASWTIGALPLDWRPVILGGYACPTGTVNTHVDLACYLTSPTGDQFGYGPGTTGAAPPPVYVDTVYGAAITGSYAKVAAGSAATIFFVAKQTAGGTDAWAVPNTTNRIGLTIGAVPLP